MVFRFKQGIKVSYKRQGYIYFTSLRYDELDEDKQRKIRKLCRECGGVHSKALFKAVTTETPDDLICDTHYIGKSTLYRMKREYYERFPSEL